MGTELILSPFCFAKLCSDIHNILGDDYQFLKSKLEFRIKTDLGYNIITLSGASKHSPYISLSFHIGKHFNITQDILKILEQDRKSENISSYALNARSFKNLNYMGRHTWDININHPSITIADEIVAAIHGIADPFFTRFLTPELAREAIAHNDSWCFGGKAFWRQLLILDLALNDLNHFTEWSKRLTDVEKNQADVMIETYHSLKKPAY